MRFFFLAAIVILASIFWSTRKISLPAAMLGVICTVMVLVFGLHYLGVI